MRTSRYIFLISLLAVVLSGCLRSKSYEQLMHSYLLEADSMNKNYVEFTSDSIMQLVVNYYDRYGNANERMKAHYLLGCVYRDLGESPRAIKCYRTAANCADTTAADCDFYVLSCVFAQMAYLYHFQQLSTFSIEAKERAIHYSYCAKDTFHAIYNLDMMAADYIMQNKKDSAEIIQKMATDLYRLHGYLQQELLSSLTLMHLYLDKGEHLPEVKQMIDRFESLSDQFNEHHELPPSKHLFYYYKGLYFDSVAQLDSAEYYYRKSYEPNESPYAQEPMYKGLLSVYRKRGQTDSTAKYAQLYCQANDSSLAVKDKTLTAQVSANYNYSRLQDEALEGKAKTIRLLIFLIISLVFVLVLAIAAMIGWKKYQRKIEKLKGEFAAAEGKYKENIQKLQLLETSHQKILTILKKELEDKQSENDDFRNKYTESQAAIKAVNQEFESGKAKLLKENQALKNELEALKLEDVVAARLKKTNAFSQEPIVMRVRQLATQPLSKLDDQTWEQLLMIFVETYPTLIHDLSQLDVKDQTLVAKVCLLTILGIRNSEQGNLLGLAKQQVSNFKATINKQLFNENTSRTLCQNLSKHYDLYILDVIRGDEALA